MLVCLCHHFIQTYMQAGMKKDRQTHRQTDNKTYKIFRLVGMGQAVENSLYMYTIEESRVTIWRVNHI